MCNVGVPISCLAATENMRWVYVGGEDGVVRKYDFFTSLNGRQALSAAAAAQGPVDVQKVSLSHLLLSFFLSFSLSPSLYLSLSLFSCCPFAKHA